MAELREVQRKLESTKALREIVNAMRNLAAIYVRRAEATLEAIRPYSEAVETALGVVLDRAGVAGAEGPSDGRCVAVVFASDQGLCGTYNDRVVRAALAFREGTAAHVDFIAIGRRACDLLRMNRAEPILSTPSPASLEGLKAHVTALAADAFEAYVEAGGEEMVFVYNTYAGMGRFEERVQPVLPPRRDALGSARRNDFRCDPILTAPPAELLGALIEEYFFIEFHRALLESHTSENGARLLSMTAASGNVEEHLLQLTQQYQSVRQDAITAELLDVVSGAEALPR